MGGFNYDPTGTVLLLWMSLFACFDETENIAYRFFPSDVRSEEGRWMDTTDPGGKCCVVFAVFWLACNIIILRRD